MTWFFDLDNTLYQKTNLFSIIDSRIRIFVMNLLDVDESKADLYRKDYFHRYGTTLRGLIKNFSIDPEEYLDFVHDIDVNRFIKTDVRLNETLQSLQQKKFVFTNASIKHADSVLSALGIAECFEFIFDTGFFDYHAKPEKVVFETITKKFTGENIMVDDYPKNIAGAKKAGFTTILVGESDSEYADMKINDIHDIKQVMDTFRIC